jgi:hypothetical protein
MGLPHDLAAHPLSRLERLHIDLPSLDLCTTSAGSDKDEATTGLSTGARTQIGGRCQR